MHSLPDPLHRQVAAGDHAVLVAVNLLVFFCSSPATGPPTNVRRVLLQLVTAQWSPRYAPIWSTNDPRAVQGCDGTVRPTMRPGTVLLAMHHDREFMKELNAVAPSPSP